MGSVVLRVNGAADIIGKKIMSDNTTQNPQDIIKFLAVVINNMAEMIEQYLKADSTISQSSIIDLAEFCRESNMYFDENTTVDELREMIRSGMKTELWSQIMLIKSKLGIEKKEKE